MSGLSNSNAGTALWLKSGLSSNAGTTLLIFKINNEDPVGRND